MGSHWSKLKKSLEKGDESKVLEIYNKSAEIRRKLNANSIVNEVTLDTYMHLSAIHGMTQFLKLLLNNKHNGNPNKLNRNNQTVLHKCCQGNVDTAQFECLKLLLEWRENVQIETKNISRKSSSSSNSTKNIEINVNAKDKVNSVIQFFVSFCKIV